jgi:hypothetical protein
MSGHVLLKPGQDGSAAVKRLHDVLHERFGVEHTTIEVEYQPLVQLKDKRAGAGDGGATPPAPHDVPS